MCYMYYQMDTTIRNLDERVYRAVRARAVLEGRKVGDLINEAMRAYLSRVPAGRRTPIQRPVANGRDRLQAR